MDNVNDINDVDSKVEEQSIGSNHSKQMRRRGSNNLVSNDLSLLLEKSPSPGRAQLEILSGSIEKSGSIKARSIQHSLIKSDDDSPSNRDRVNVNLLAAFDAGVRHVEELKNAEEEKEKEKDSLQEKKGPVHTKEHSDEKNPEDNVVKDGNRRILRSLEEFDSDDNLDFEFITGKLLDQRILLYRTVIL